jgi:hypothetical protein
MKINSIYFDSSKPTCHIECWNSSDIYDEGRDDDALVVWMEQKERNNT